MRPIIFRGKTLFSHKWVEGYYDYNLVKGIHIIHETGKLPPSQTEPGGDVHSEYYEVDPYTVGEYTGLIDRNEKRIFEDDIVRFHQFLFDGTKIEKEGTCVIEAGQYGWLASHIIHNDVGEYMGYSKKEQLEGKCECYFIHFYGLHEESFEIIGNIHDTPELLKHGF